MKVSVITLGCPKSLVESERILGQFNDKVEFTEPEDGDVVILKTCGFIEPACEECVEWLEKLSELKRSSKKKIFVVGCLVDRFGAEIKKEYPFVDEIVPLADEKKIAELIGVKQRKKDERLVTTFPYAFLMISDGCDNRCRYCTIPFIRGDYRSFPFDDLVAEAQALAGVGIKEVILIAQDTGYYGYDKEGRSLLPDLIDRITAIDSIEWIRVMYLHPAHVDDELITRFKENEKLCRYADIPIQHCSDKILKAMGRKVTKKDLKKLFDRLREIEGICLRTTLMTGFPGESDQDFEELMLFTEDVGFEHFGAFPFYAEPETEAAHLPDQVAAETILKRLKALEELRDEMTDSFNNSFVGKKIKVLVDGEGSGRRECDAPEIDSVVQFKGEAELGEFVSVKIKEAEGWRLKGKLCR